jgi:hypothetical protein
VLDDFRGLTILDRIDQGATPLHQVAQRVKI